MLQGIFIGVDEQVNVFAVEKKFTAHAGEIASA